MTDDKAAAVVIGVLAFCALWGACCLLGLAIQALICWLIQGAQARVPMEHRLMSPGAVWLLMIPLFSLVWIFFVATRIPDSISAARKARGMPAGDCGRSVGIAMACAIACSSVLGLIGGAQDGLMQAMASGGASQEDLMTMAGSGGAVNCFSNLASLAYLVLLIIFIVKIRSESKALVGPAGFPQA